MRTQKSEKSGRSTALSWSLVGASMEMYSCVHGRSVSICSGNCAFVTMKEEMPRACSPSRKALICG